MLTVIELAEAAVAATQDDREENVLTVPALLCLLDVHGTRNAHLANPLNHPPLGRGGFKPREVRLSGAEPVHGAFLALSYCGHDPLVHLFDFDDIKSLEQMLASDSGIVNSLINYSVAFIDGKVARYQIAYRGDDGSIGRFDKHLQNTQGKQPAERANNRWVVWNTEPNWTRGAPDNADSLPIRSY
jgi:hypothetical protein